MREVDRMVPNLNLDQEIAKHFDRVIFPQRIVGDVCADLGVGNLYIPCIC